MIKRQKIKGDGEEEKVSGFVVWTRRGRNAVDLG